MNKLIFSRSPLLLLYLSTLLTPSIAFAATPSFSDVSSQLNLPGTDDEFAGVGWIDYNNDGWQDLYIPLGNTIPNRLYRNVNGASFELVANSGADLLPKGNGVAVADFDNDGWDDLIVISNNQTVLLRNNGNSTFTQLSEPALEATGGKLSAAFGDIDGDGDLDLVTSSNNELFKNNTVETNGDCVTTTDACFELINVGFTNMTFPTFAVAMTDYDLDGDLDIYFIVDGKIVEGQSPYEPATMYRNDTVKGGDIVFSAVNQNSGLLVGLAGMGIAIGDYNRDNKLDYFLSSAGKPAGPLSSNATKELGNNLLRNKGDNTFENVAIELGLWGKKPGFYWGSSFSDFNNDANLDLIIGGDSGNELFLNNGDGTFTDVSVETGIYSTYGVGIAVADFNRDGLVDIASHYGTGYFYLMKNTTNDKKQWMQINLHGIVSNRRGIGAKVRLTSTTSSGDITQLSEINAGTSMSSSHQLMAHFGIPVGTTSNTLQVEWPSGCVQTIPNITVGPHEITESCNCP